MNRVIKGGKLIGLLIVLAMSIQQTTPRDAIKQGTYFERLSEKTQCASRGRSFVQMLVGQSRDQDYWSHNARSWSSRSRLSPLIPGM